MALGRRAEVREAPEPRVQTAGHVEAAFNRLDEDGHPGFRQHAPGPHRPDHERLRPPRGALRDGQVRQAMVGPAPRQAELAETPFPPPVDDALSGLGRERVLRVRREEQVRRLDAQQHGCGQVSAA